MSNWSRRRCISATGISIPRRTTATSAKSAKASRASGVPREDVFITTKVWFNRLAPGDLERSVDESLERLKLPWVDLLLIHWPNAQIPLAGSIDALCKVKRAGLGQAYRGGQFHRRHAR